MYIYTGNTSLFSVEPDKLHNRYICQEHFPPESFIQNFSQNRLIDTAIPYNYESKIQPSTSSGFDQNDKSEQEYNILISTPTKTYTRSKSDMVELVFPSPPSLFSTPQKAKITNIIEMPSPNLKRKSDLIEIDTPRKIHLKQKLKQKNKIIHNKIAHISKLKKKRISTVNTHNNIKNLINMHNFSSINSKAMVTMQLKDRRRPWTLNEKNLALNLYYKSPTAYKFLRSQKVNLPGPSTIRRWIGQSKFLPGFSQLFFSHIQKKFESSDYKGKACTVCFDEMYIKEFIEYSKEFDFIEGLEDLGHYGRTNKSANCVLVFMARGIYSPWKFPIAYFLAHSGVNKTILKNLIIDVLQKLFEVGLCPKIIVCDQGTNNQSTLKSLNVSEDSPFFFINNNKIFSLFDVPHLVKSIRNNLINACYIKDNKIISFDDIKKTYELDKQSHKSRSLVKITDAHIYPNSFQKMRVKLAAQLLSNSMSATIRTCIQTGQLQSDTSSNTADFIEFINHLFDCLNSKSLYSHNPYLCALTDLGTVKQFLIGASLYFTNLQKLKKGKLTQPPCFKGFTQTINGVLQFFEEEKSNNIVFLMTNRLNQDILENLFSIFRQNGGYNKNPTARTIRTSIRSNCIFSLCTSKGTNCEATQEDNNPVIIDPVSSLSKTNVNSSTLSSDSDSDTDCNSNLSLCFFSSDEDSVKTDNIDNHVTLEDCSVTYFSGYLGYKCIKKFDCNHCQLELFIDKNLNDKKQILLLNKNYSSIDNESGLKAPSNNFNNVINTILNIFENNYENYLNKKKIRFQIIKRVKNNKTVIKWLDGSMKTCIEHKMYIIEHLLICKIFNKTKMFSTTSKLAKLSKLKIINHI